MDPKRVGQAGLIGWRERVGHRVASTLASRTRMREDTARAVVGFGFLALTLRTAGKMLARARGGARD
jgi:hypothetical protein